MNQEPTTRKRNTKPQRIPTVVDPTISGTLSIAEAAAKLGIGTSTGYYLAAKGEFPVRVILIGSTKKVLKADMDRYLAGETREAG